MLVVLNGLDIVLVVVGVVKIMMRVVIRVMVSGLIPVAVVSIRLLFVVGHWLGGLVMLCLSNFVMNWLGLVVHGLSFVVHWFRCLMNGLGHMVERLDDFLFLVHLRFVDHWG